MSAQPPTHDGNSLLVRILDGYLADRAAGRAPSVEDLVARHPELAGELRECLASLEALKAAAPPAAVGLDVPTGDGEMRTGVLGDYRILREVGRGGMGVVYEAWQISLGRRVALKVLPFAATLDPRHLQRFKNEAQAAAQLHHSHIVPVFAVGVERGVHYYAMQFIDGRNLAAVIDELRRGPDPDPLAATRLNPDELPQTAPYLPKPPPAPTTSSGQAHASTERSSKSSTAFFRTAAQLTLQAADALEHAHGLGVVHRDIKPANLLVDSRGHLWVTDFGLAQFGRDANLTVTGDLLGTLRYMSPEQAAAKRAVIDHRTDIYSLGATLYELLTQQPVFDSTDRQALLGQIMNDEPIPPRRHNKAVPVELELITLKALAKNPEERYATAQDLADDLRRFLEDKPVLARRPTLMQHVRKWARRHQALVAAGAGFVVLALGTTSLSTVRIWQERNEAQRQRDDAERQRVLAEAQKQEAERQRELAEAQRQLALQALGELFNDARPTAVVNDPLQREFLVKSLKFYEQEVRRDVGPSAEAHQERAIAFRRMGHIHEQLGQAPEAEQAYRESVRLLRALVEEHPHHDQYTFELATSTFRLGNLLKSLGKREEAVQVLEEAQKLSRHLAAADATNSVKVNFYVQVAETCQMLDTSGGLRKLLSGEFRYERTDLPDGEAARGTPRLVSLTEAVLEPGLLPRTPSATPSVLPPPSPAAAAYLLAMQARQNEVRLLPKLSLNENAPALLAADKPPSNPASRDGAGSNPYEPYQGPYVPTPGGVGGAAGNPYSTTTPAVSPYFFSPSVQKDRTARFAMQAALPELQSGTALNDLLDRLNMKLAAGLKLGKDAGPSLDPVAVRKLNLAAQPRPGLPVVRALRRGELRWPLALQEESLAETRQRISEGLRAAVEVPKKDASGSRTELSRSVEAARNSLCQRISDLPPAQFLEARRFLDQVEDAVQLFDKVGPSDDLAEQFVKEGKLTALDLVAFMRERKLRFGSAAPGEEEAYLSVFRALAAFEAALPAGD